MGSVADDLQHLSQIETAWSVIERATNGQGPSATSAQHWLARRYVNAVYRYLRALTRDPELAADLTQEFALRLLGGHFRKADPHRGRFRDFLKASAVNLVREYHRRRRLRPGCFPPGAPEPAVAALDPAEVEREFLASWRAELLDAAWAALAASERRTGRPVYTVLHFRAENPQMRSARMAEALARRLGRPITDVWVRQNLLRARAEFAALIFAEVRRSLSNPDPSPEQVEEEMRALDLWKFCCRSDPARPSGTPGDHATG